MNNFKKQLDELDLIKLREMANSYGVKNYYRKNKKDLIEAILHQMYILMH